MNYKKIMRLVPIPILLLIVCSIYVLFLVETNQLNLDIDFKGGTQIVASTGLEVSDAKLESDLKQYDAVVRTSRSLNGYTVFINFDASVDSDAVLKTLSDAGYSFSQHSVQTVGPATGAGFFQQALIVLAFSFVLMAVTVFVMFKNPMPSIFMILTVTADLVETIAFIQILGIKISLATFAALLLLIGAAVGDNVMFTTKLLKGTDKNYDDIITKTFRTGITMFAAVQSAFMALLLISASNVITQIAIISIIGGTLDLMNSWVMNLGLLMRYITRKIK
jgi:preprotein translocase subunit SecF